ncbi:MAG: 30S ribosomal protein S20 [Rickettsiales bacterium]|nr:30S ribosomal protein S20 [Rickettsiales bacterium]
MANTKSAIKALRGSTRKNEVNSARKNRIRSFVKKVNDAVKESDAKKAAEALKALQPELMRGVTKKIIKLNTASRKLSRLSASIKKISKKA